MIYFYRLLINLVIPFVLISLVIRGFKNPAYWQRWKERFGFIPENVKKVGEFDLWLHAVSVGEARAASPLINRLLTEQPDIKILITTTTPTGSAMVRMMLQDKVSHCYLPYDLNWAMKRFVNSVNPETVLVMETEIWPNLISTIKNYGATLVYTNVRLSERSYQGYAKLQKFAKQTLDQIDHFAVQGKTDRKHLELLGVDVNKISETGSIKFDVYVPPSLRESAEVMRRQLGQDRLVWIAGSTREGEEGKIIAAYKQLKKEFPSLLLMLVPRHPERFDYIARKVQRRGLNCVRRTEAKVEIAADVDVYLGDTMGELSLMYACSDVAFVGGSLVPLGGQNILEPCALGVPVVFGQHMFNFPDISRWTIKEKAGKMVRDTDELISVVSELLSNPSLRDEMGNNGMKFIEAHRGALDKNYILIDSLTRDTVNSNSLA